MIFKLFDTVIADLRQTDSKNFNFVIFIVFCVYLSWNKILTMYVDRAM